jgi:transcriptional regulator with XRE-family HTH domain
VGFLLFKNLFKGVRSMGFTTRLKELRLQKDLSQNQLAKELKTYSANVSDWERGIKKPTMDSIIAIADYFDITTDYLLGRE